MFGSISLPLRASAGRGLSADRAGASGSSDLNSPSRPASAELECRLCGLLDRFGFNFISSARLGGAGFQPRRTARIIMRGFSPWGRRIQIKLESPVRGRILKFPRRISESRFHWIVPQIGPVDFIMLDRANPMFVEAALPDRMPYRFHLADFAGASAFDQLYCLLER